MKRLYLLIISFLAVAASLTVYGQGTTTASFSGRITDQSGEPLPGATVVALNVPTGVETGNVTDLNGYFRIPNIQVGGPYQVTITYVGYETITLNNLYLKLGQVYSINRSLNEGSTELDEVTISASSIMDGNQTGQETMISEELINATPTVTRSLADFARLNPLANIGEGGDGFTISIAGQNNRYNAIYIDGAVNNDVFGLAGGGTNGGQTGVQPISIDAIEQFQVSVAPFDVRKSGFAGGAVNAVTRSGTNEIKGSAYYFHRNQNLAGRTPTDNPDVERERLDDFTANTYGFRVGGPVIKNKMFFFVNAELQRDETPQPFDINDYAGNSTAADLENLENFVNNTYNYDLLGYDNNTAFLNSEKFLAKLDYNINDNNKLTIRHSYVNAENLEARNSSRNEINFLNGSEYFISTTNSSALELNTLIGNTMSNRLIIGATIVRDDRDPLNDDNPFPTVRIFDGPDQEINFGAERFSTANRLDQDIITINNDLEIYKGKHTLLAGVNVEYFRAANLFIRNNYGRYTYTNLDDFINQDTAFEYERSFSQVDNIAGDESDAIAEFSQVLAGFYFQDEIQMTENFRLTAGIRVDIPFWLTDQPLNEDFNNNDLPRIQGLHDVKGAQTGQFIKPQLLFSPRIGFNYDVKGDKTFQLRGGIGIFTSRIPLVWPGGAYNNYGLNIGADGGRNEFVFNPDVQNQPVQADLNNLVPSGQIDLFSEDFRLPQVLKINLAADYVLGDNYILTGELLFTKNINAVQYDNINLVGQRGQLAGSPDDRPLFYGATPEFGDSVFAPNYNYIMLGSNTNQGYSYNISGSVSKNYDNGFQTLLSYTYGDAFSTYDGGSSQNNSQWRGYHPAIDLENENYNGSRNDSENANVQRSGFALGHRILGQVSYAADYLRFGRSTFSLNFEGRTGGYFSHVVGARQFLFTDEGGFDNNELIYVPTDATDPSQINIVDLEDDDGVVIWSAADQRAALEEYISNNDYLDSRRGNYAERNGGKLPFEFTADFRFLQDFYIETAKGKRNTLQLSVDIFNLTNLLNQDWGRRRFAGSFGNYALLNLDNVTLSEGDNTPEYTVNTDLQDGDDPWTSNVDDSGFRSSRWQMQIGIRYIFN